MDGNLPNARVPRGWAVSARTPGRLRGGDRAIGNG
jgi:hypothetical protein